MTNGKSVILYRLGEYDDALTAIDEAILLDPQDAANWKIRSDLLFQLGKYNDALKSIDKSIELSPNEADYWKKRGTILQKMGPSYKEDARDALAYAKELSN
jgi:tetratricopeptide (TPR) repeat protein